MNPNTKDITMCLLYILQEEPLSAGVGIITHAFANSSFQPYGPGFFRTGSSLLIFR